MKINLGTHLLFVMVTICVIIGSTASAQDLTSSTKANYGSLKVFCGRDEIPINEMKIPQIGCIYLSSGHKATGEFSGHNVEITVGADGIEEFRVDGMLVETKIGANRTVSGTNLPYVHLWGGSTGFSFCSDPAASSCPS